MTYTVNQNSNNVGSICRHQIIAKKVRTNRYEEIKKMYLGKIG